MTSSSIIPHALWLYIKGQLPKASVQSRIEMEYKYQANKEDQSHQSKERPIVDRDWRIAKVDQDFVAKANTDCHFDCHFDKSEQWTGIDNSKDFAASVNTDCHFDKSEQWI
jgi:hypothetical protein